jgi:hypothetical protein
VFFSIVDGIRAYFSQVIEDIKRKLKDLFDTARMIITQIRSAFQIDFDGLAQAAAEKAKTYFDIETKAKGGLTSGPVTLVGEQGPELVSLPRGSYVHNAHNTERMLGEGSGTTKIEFNSPIVGQVIVQDEADEDRLIAKLTRAIQLHTLAA